MSAFYFAVYNILIKIAASGLLSKLSLINFTIALTIGTVYLFICVLLKKVREKNCVWCFYCFASVYISDLTLCYLQYKFFGGIYQSITKVLLLCTTRYMLLIALYAAILLVCKLFDFKIQLQNKGICSSFSADKTEEKKQVIRLKESVCSKNGVECPLSIDLIGKVMEQKRTVHPCDVNLSYVKGVLNALNQKNLTQEEREFTSDLNFILSSSIPAGGEEQRDLNKKLCVLIKKITEYQVDI